MDRNFNVVFYGKSENRPALEFIRGLDHETRKKVYSYINLLENYGNLLRPPYSKKISGVKGLFELRVESSSNEYRFFYCFIPGKIIVILHAIQKKRNKTPQEEIKTAEKRMKELVK